MIVPELVNFRLSRCAPQLPTVQVGSIGARSCNEISSNSETILIPTKDMNDILFISATHGDEPIGVRALESLEKTRSNFDWIIGNPRAFALNKRFTDADLNRSAPGMFTGATYESRRAAELISLTKRYDVVIDLHGTSQSTGLFMIVTNPSEQNLQLASMIDVDRIVIWPAITSDLSGPLSEFFPVGLEIECGPKEEAKTQQELERVLDDFLDNKDRRLDQDWREVLKTKQIFEVYGEFREDPGVELKEFEEVTVDEETFAPLLISVYKGAYDVLCYKLRKCSVESLLL